MLIQSVPGKKLLGPTALFIFLLGAILFLTVGNIDRETLVAYYQAVLAPEGTVTQ